MLNHLMTVFRFAKWRSLGLVIFMVVSTFLEGLGLLMIIPLLGLIGIDLGGASPSGPFGALVKWFANYGLHFDLSGVLALYVGVAFLLAASQYIRSVLSTRLQVSYSQSLSHQVHEALVHANWQFLSQQKLPIMAHVLTSEISRISFSINQLLMLLSTMILTIGYIAIAFALSWQLTSMTLVAAFVVYVFSRPFDKKIRLNGKNRHLAGQQFYEAIMRHLSGLKLAKSLGTEGQCSRQFAEVNDKIHEQQLEFARQSGLTSLVYQVSSVIVLSILVYFEITRFHVTTAMLLTLILLFSRLIPKMNAIHSYYQMVLNLMPAFDTVTNLLVSAREAKEHELIPNDLEFSGKLELKDISYTHARQHGEVASVEKVSLTLMPNQTYAIIGPSGAGKSTLADVLAGLLVPQYGQIEADGVLCTPANIKNWRRNVGYCTQEAVIFNGTVRDNLIYAAPNVTDEEIWRFLSLVAAEDLVRGLAKGLDTEIGEGGVRLSGGEQQRIALARILLTRPRLLILDEATCHLDPALEERVFQNLRACQNQMTIVSITHRMLNLKFAHWIIELANGSLVSTSPQLAR